MLRGGWTWREGSAPLVGGDGSLSLSVSSIADLTQRRRKDDGPRDTAHVCHSPAVRHCGNRGRSSSGGGSEDEMDGGIVKSRSGNNNRFRLSTGGVAARMRGQLEATERELEHTKGLLLQYKGYVENRLLRHIENLEEGRTQREQLCERLKRDNALLLQELQRLRTEAAGEVSSRVGAMKEGCRRLASSPAPPRRSLPREDVAPCTLQMLRSREEVLLQQLHVERAGREQLEAAHANALTMLQEQMSRLELERQTSMDGQTIEGLRQVLARRDEEIRQLRKMHDSFVMGTLGAGQHGVAAELQMVAEDGAAFVEAIYVAADTARSDCGLGAAAESANEDVLLSGAARLWDEARRVASSLKEEAATISTPEQPRLLLDAVKAMRCAVEQEHSRIAVLVRELLAESEKLRECLSVERHAWNVERQAAAHRLREVEDEGKMLAQQQRDVVGLRATSWMCQGALAVAAAAASNEREGGAICDGPSRRDASTQTLLSEELCVVHASATSRHPVAADLNQLLRDVETLERDNAAKAALIAQLQQQRERFLGSVDTDLATNIPVRSALTGTFSNYLLE